MTARRARAVAAAHYLAAALLLVGGAIAIDRWGPAAIAALADAGYVLERPELVVALALIPLLVAVRAHTLSDLPRAQQALSLLFKSAFVALITASLVNPMKLDSVPGRSATVFVVDVSESIPDAVLARARDALQEAWDARGEHEVRLVVFGAEAREIPLGPAATADAPAPGDAATAATAEAETPLPPIPRLEGDAGLATDAQGALRLALTLLPDGALPRLVLITDGLETRGDLAAEIVTARRFGVPVHFHDFTDVPRASELMVVGLEVPDNVKPNVPFPVRAKARATAPIDARCELSVDGEVVETLEEALARGDGEVFFELTLRSGGEKRIAVRCEAVAEGADRFASNNRFEVPIKVPEKPKILYVEGERQFARNLATGLGDDFDVELRGPRGVPSSLADAKRYDLIFISDVPRVGEMGYQNVTLGQMRALEQYARAGGGVIFAGGEASFGPGGYSDTHLERAVLPVRLDVQRKQDMAGVALVLAIDRSGSMTGPKIELAKQAAIATLGVLQPSDLLGIVAFDSRADNLVRLQRASNRYKITETVGRLRPGGGTNVFAALDLAYSELSRVQAKVKHIILLTDGQSNRDGILRLVSGSAQDKITISTVAVGLGSDVDLLQRIAEEGRGRYYFTNSPQNVPKLFLKETTEVSRRALVEDRFRPRVDPRYRHLQMFSGLDMARAPSLVGYVATRAKPRAEVIMTSHLGEPILARWRLGLGTVMVWTSDVKAKWAHYWLSWPGYAKFWRQVIRDTMRVEREDPSYHLVADVVDGELTVGVDAVDDEDRFIEGLVSEVTVVDPDGEERAVALTQTAAGRYTGRLALTKYGPYTVRGVHAPRDRPDDARASFATVAWPFPQEHLAGEPDLGPVRELAEATGGAADPSAASLFDVGDARIESRTPMWPWPLYPALVLLVLDVALRRVRLYGKTRLSWAEVGRAR